MRASAGLVLGVLLLSGSGMAGAEPGHATRVIAVPTVKIGGRVQTPLASVEVSRAEPNLTLSDLRPTFADRIGKAIAHDPY